MATEVLEPQWSLRVLLAARCHSGPSAPSSRGALLVARRHSDYSAPSWSPDTPTDFSASYLSLRALLAFSVLLTIYALLLLGVILVTRLPHGYRRSFWFSLSFWLFESLMAHWCRYPISLVPFWTFGALLAVCAPIWSLDVILTALLTAL